MTQTRIFPPAAVQILRPSTKDTLPPITRDNKSNQGTTTATTTRPPQVTSDSIVSAPPLVLRFALLIKERVSLGRPITSRNNALVGKGAFRVRRRRSRLPPPLVVVVVPIAPPLLVRQIGTPAL